MENHKGIRKQVMSMENGWD